MPTSKHILLSAVAAILAACVNEPSIKIDRIVPNSGKPGSEFVIYGSGFKHVAGMSVGKEVVEYVIDSDERIRVWAPYWLKTGKVVVWGEGSLFGDGDIYGPEFHVEHYERITPPVRFVELMASGDYHCGRSAEGVVSCWNPACGHPFGRNDDGSVRFVTYQASSPWKTLPDRGRMCGLLESGEAACIDLLSNGTVDYPIPRRWKEIAANGDNYCGMDSTGFIRCGPLDPELTTVLADTTLAMATPYEDGRLTGLQGTTYALVTASGALHFFSAYVEIDPATAMIGGAVEESIIDADSPLAGKTTGWKAVWEQPASIHNLTSYTYGIRNDELVMIDEGLKPIERLPPYRSVSSGWQANTCILTTAGKVICRGSSLGDVHFIYHPDEMREYGDMKYFEAPFLESAEALATGDTTCAIEPSGDLVCWDGAYLTPGQAAHLCERRTGKWWE